jgi:hypothetical protein
VDDRGWIPGYLQVAHDGRLHVVSCAPHGLIAAEWAEWLFRTQGLSEAPRPYPGSLATLAPRAFACPASTRSEPYL